MQNLKPSEFWQHTTFIKSFNSVNVLHQYNSTLYFKFSTRPLTGREMEGGQDPHAVRGEDGQRLVGEESRHEPAEGLHHRARGLLPHGHREPGLRERPHVLYTLNTGPNTPHFILYGHTAPNPVLIHFTKTLTEAHSQSQANTPTGLHIHKHTQLSETHAFHFAVPFVNNMRKLYSLITMHEMKKMSQERKP